MKFNSQICTSVEQSNRLLDLGLKPETADMSIIANAVDYNGVKYSLTPYSETNHPKMFGVIPAWSLHRLIELSVIGIIDSSTDDIYDKAIQYIEFLIKCGDFNEEYLEGKK